jgi:hypothetical protein
LLKSEEIVSFDKFVIFNTFSVAVNLLLKKQRLNCFVQKSKVKKNHFRQLRNAEPFVFVDFYITEYE